MTSPGSNQEEVVNPGASLTPNPDEVNEFHRYSDQDSVPEAQHHTLGQEPNQAAAGNHAHNGRDSKVLDGYALTAHEHDTVSGITGSVIMFAASLPPDGWVLCNGQFLNRLEYAGLFAVIGTTFSAGDGTTTFGVPNLASRFPIGNSASYPLGSVGGSKDHQHANGTESHGHGASGSGSDSGHGHAGIGHSHSVNGHTHGFTGSSHNHSASTAGHAHGSVASGSATTTTQTPGTTVVAATGGGTVGSGNEGILNGTASVASGNANISVGVSVGSGNTTKNDAVTDKSLPPYISLNYIMKA